jgi:hypothetical protein
MTEKEFQNQVLEYLNARGVMCWPNAAVSVFDPKRGKFRKSKNRFHRNGIPDILGILPGGRFLGIELKRPPEGKRKPETLQNMLSCDQFKFIEDAGKSGALCFVADSLETIIAKLAEPISRCE